MDAAVPDRPAMAPSISSHDLWVNSKALALAGVTKDTPDPPNGKIVKDPNTGEPTGYLIETAAALVTRVAPGPTKEDKRKGLPMAIAEMHRVGITSVQQAGGNAEEFEVFDEARRAGELHVRVYSALNVAPGFTAADADRLETLRRKYGEDDPLFKVGAIKMFNDGIIEANTAYNRLYMLANYDNVPSRAKPYLEAEEFHRIVTMISARTAPRRLFRSDVPETSLRLE